MKSLTVLLIDDSDDLLSTLSWALKLEGFGVLTATSGRRGFEMARVHKPDVILLDALMPHMDGFNTCVDLKQNPETRAIPVIMVTGVNQIKDVEKAFASGAGDYVTKPFDNQRLFDKIRKVAAP